jgi:hypothetical protein
MEGSLAYASTSSLTGSIGRSASMQHRNGANESAMIRHRNRENEATIIRIVPIVRAVRDSASKRSERIHDNSISKLRKRSHDYRGLMDRAGLAAAGCWHP